MQIILLSGRSARTVTFSLGRAQGIGLALAGLALGAGLLLLGSYAALRYAAHGNGALASALARRVAAEQTRDAQGYLRASLDAMAAQLGQMQAQLARLDALGDRLGRAAGFKPQEFQFERLPGRGGALGPVPSRPLDMAALDAQIHALAGQIERHGDVLAVLESDLRQASVARQLVPTQLPVAGGFRSSDFGWRLDPFTGEEAYHEGVDFNVAEGTPIHAAAAGVVVFAGVHPQYGNMVEVDHGNALVTRYGHAARLLVKVGDVVQRGSTIAEVGSTGRSTGAHLHFEVRLKGTALNPARFLRPPA